MQEAFLPFNLPILGLHQGIHEYEFRCDPAFFKLFEKSLVESGNFHVNLSLDKKIDMLVLDFGFTGAVAATCDRCLAPIQLPVEGGDQLILKYADGVSDDVDIIFIQKDRDHYNVAEYVHEIIELALPIINKYDCEAEKIRPCDFKVLEVLEARSAIENKEGNPLWDSLKNLNIDN